MPWTNQGGNGGGPWKPSNPGPWGQGPSNNNNNNNTPDLEEFLRRSQERMRRMIPGGDFGALGLAAVAMLIVVVWLLSGFYTIAPNEVGLNLVFGKYTGKTQAGLNYNWPYPIGDVDKLQVTDRNSIDIGSISREDSRRPGVQLGMDIPEESLMLTGDENIADVKFRVIWQIDPAHPEDYAFNLRNPNETVKAVAESAMREVIGRFNLQGILTSDRTKVEQTTQDLTQGVLTSYKAGVLVLQTQLLSVGPPAQVISSYRDVTAAQQDLQRQRNESEAYANRIVPEARGAAAAIIQEAQGYREQTVQQAQGQASRFTQVYDQYKNAPDVTRERIYIETMEQVLSGTDKIILDDKQGVVPYLPLGALGSTTGQATAPKAGQTGVAQ
ncbi:MULTISPECIES: FtsH protease activity modulator HflK [Lichenihabitans]|uniref:FtsH protease activity modulator HflK n=1 Tax=Lichenihabitans TaxID=2723776 RepID=UPI001035B481|nr:MULTISPECIES: FtsH protease activity modulator HflK [Lichenihabitans]UDL93622.1 FtsH protease activity modulator HflK [Lichenihabitans sp. PAMC28606]